MTLFDVLVRRKLIRFAEAEPPPQGIACDTPPLYCMVSVTGAPVAARFVWLVGNCVCATGPSSDVSVGW